MHGIRIGKQQPLPLCLFCPKPTSIVFTRKLPIFRQGRLQNLYTRKPRRNLPRSVGRGIINNDYHPISPQLKQFLALRNQRSEANRKVTLLITCRNDHR